MNTTKEETPQENKGKEALEDDHTEDLITFKKSGIKKAVLLAVLVCCVIVAITLGSLKAARGSILDSSDSSSSDDFEDSSDDEGEAQEFDSIKFFFELNDSDNDLGVQLKLGADPWKRLAIKSPNGETILDVEADGSLEEHGMSDLFFESAEPEFATGAVAVDEDGEPLKTKQDILDRFPAGTYTFLGLTTDGALIRGQAELTHDLPAAVEISTPQDKAVVPLADLIVAWNAVTMPAGIEIASYEIIVTKLEDEDFVLDQRVPGTSTSATIPASFLEAGVDYELEVLAREATGNQVITIHFFKVE